jgi:hypothetical protein
MMTDPLKIGDILESSWGYDQTNVDFYQVVKSTASTVTLRKINAKTVAGDGWTGKVTPIKDDFDDAEPLRRKVKDGWNGEPYVKVKSYAMAHRWDGKPVNYTAYA